MKLHRLTDQGLRELAEFLTAVRAGTRAAVPHELLERSGNLVAHESGVELEERAFGSRRQAAEYLHSVLTCLEPGIRRDVGTWAYLSLLWFRDLSELDHGSARIGALDRWIPSLDDGRRYYRHLLLGPYLIYSAHQDQPDSAMALLCQPLARPGELVEQMAARPELVTSPAVVRLVTDLYYDRSAGKLKRGASGKGQGSPRRLADVLMQLVLTHDLHATSADALMRLIPTEFRRFLPDR